MSTKNLFGTLSDGRKVRRFLIGNDDGMRVELLDLGAMVNSIRLVGSDPSSEVAIGFDSLEDQQTAASAYFGAVVGRYANRLAEGRFTVDGATYETAANEGTTTLHGGIDGFNTRTWDVVEHTASSVTFQLVSPDGDQGFPGELTATARYALIENGLRLELSATTDTPTICALTSHLYLNLAGLGTVDEHVLRVDADRYVPIDELSIPLGRLDDVTATPFDLREGARIGDAVRSSHSQILLAKGIDHSFDIPGDGLRRMATVVSPDGVTLELFSDQPALQCYTGNFLEGLWRARDGRLLRQGDAFALEPHEHPDTPNQPWPRDAVLRPGQEWSSTIEWRFHTAANHSHERK